MTRKHRSGTIYKRGGVYWLKYMVEGKRLYQSLETGDIEEAEKRRTAIMRPYVAASKTEALAAVVAKLDDARAAQAKVEDEVNPPLSLAAAWNEYLASTERPDSSEATLEQYGFQWGTFARWMHDNHPNITALRDVNKAIADDFAAYLIREKKSAGTFNKYMNLLALVYRTLKDKAKLTGNPWEDIQRKRMIPQSRRELTTDELKTVCGAAEGEMRLLFAIGIYTGLRRGDCATLRWGEVDLKRGRITRIPNKTARRNPKPVLIPIHPVLAGMLAETPRADRGEYILPETATMYQRDPSAVSKRIQAHFEDCGIRTVKEGTGFKTITDADGKTKEVFTGKRGVVEVGFHSLRHTFVSLCREANAPLAVVEAIVGHSNPAMTRHYTHVSEQAAGLAVASLPSIYGDAAPAKALPAGDPLEAFKGQVRALADKLDGKNVLTIKAELQALCGE